MAPAAILDFVVQVVSSDRITHMTPRTNCTNGDICTKKMLLLVHCMSTIDSNINNNRYLVIPLVLALYVTCNY